MTALVEKTVKKQTDKLKKKKKKKEKSNTDANAVTVGADEQQPTATVSEPDAADTDKQARKLKKKQAKLAAAQPQSAAPTDQQPDQAAPTLDKKQKKDKKTKHDEPAAAASGPEQPPVKKRKVAVVDSAPRLAEVGDHALAASAPRIIKQLYTEDPEVTKMSADAVAKLQAERATTVHGSDIKPVLTFAQTGLPANMLFATKDFVQPSPIQSQCWPIIMSGHDLVGVAATGSGKTLAFGLPALRHIAAQKEAGVVKGKGPFALVMAPTRELAIQIAEVLEMAGSKCSCSCLCVYGGVPKAPQAKALRQGVDIVVGTPGRLEDLMGDNVCRLNEVTYLVLDEGDRMLDLGFEPHIRAISSVIRADRQTLMFSATWPSAVQQLAAHFQTSPVKVTIGSMDLSASHSVSQVVEVIEQYGRDKRLLELLKKHHSSRQNRIIIFVLYKKEAPRVEQALQRAGWTAASIHGDISQVQRQQAVEQFKSGKVPLLIATDVAARGLDIPDVEVVINYSFPLTTEDYVHRIGRTGRAGKTGIAHTFFCAPQDKPRAGELINVLREAGQTVPEELLKFGTTVKKKESKLYGAHFKDVDFSAKASKISFDSDDE